MRFRLHRRALLVGLGGVVGCGLIGCNADPAPAPTASTIEPNARPRTFVGRATTDGQGATLTRMFPNAPGHHLDPFVLLDDFAVTPPAGFPEHPHRGFEAFTYMLDGTFHHQDNLGNDSFVSSGGVQLFTSGKGARHSEMPGEARPNRGLQLWINLPARLKKMPPAYAGIDPRNIPEEHGGGVRRRTVVGAGSPVALQTEVRYLDLALERAARFADQIEQGMTALLYVVSGQVRVGDVELSTGQVALPSAGALDVVALAEARTVLLVGRPHGEPIHQHGPFVD